MRERPKQVSYLQRHQLSSDVKPIIPSISANILPKKSDRSGDVTSSRVRVGAALNKPKANNSSILNSMNTGGKMVQFIDIDNIPDGLPPDISCFSVDDIVDDDTEYAKISGSPNSFGLKPPQLPCEMNLVLPPSNYPSISSTSSGNKSSPLIYPKTVSSPEKHILSQLNKPLSSIRHHNQNNTNINKFEDDFDDNDDESDSEDQKYMDDVKTTHHFEYPKDKVITKHILSKNTVHKSISNVTDNITENKKNNQSSTSTSRRHTTNSITSNPNPNPTVLSSSSELKSKKMQNEEETSLFFSRQPRQVEFK